MLTQAASPTAPPPQSSQAATVSHEAAEQFLDSPVQNHALTHKQPTIFGQISKSSDATELPSMKPHICVDSCTDSTRHSSSLMVDAEPLPGAEQSIRNLFC